MPPADKSGRGIAALAVCLAMMSGCLFDPFGRNVKQLDAEVADIETRVGRLEVAQGIANPTSAAAPLTPGYDTFSSSASVGAPVAPAASRWPGWPINWRRSLGKLARGLTNLITGWVEIPKRVDETSERSGPGTGFTWGFLRGLGRGFVRTVGGAYEAVTFLVPVPPDYRPVMRPPYVFRCDEPQP